LKLTDIARLAGVSLTTASYVINGQAAKRRISTTTVQRVEKVVQQYGYQPNPQAASLRRGQSRCLGFLLPDLENPSYARLAKLLEQRAREAGYQLLIASTDDAPDSERQLLKLFRSRRCDALIVASCLPTEAPEYRQLLAAGTPVIAVDRALDPAHLCSVISDDRQAAIALTRSLLTSPPQRAVLIGGRPELVISQAREQGFRQALENLGANPSIHHGAQFSRHCGYQQMRQLLVAGHAPDLLVTTAYVLLEGVLDALNELPKADFRRLRLGTFGDAQLLDFLPMRVNAISQQHELIAEQVFQRLQAALDGTYQPGILAIERRLKIRG
jgi:LacI family fructose operon transcriptional repressor